MAKNSIRRQNIYGDTGLPGEPLSTRKSQHQHHPQLQISHSSRISIAKLINLAWALQIQFQFIINVIGRTEIEKNSDARHSCTAENHTRCSAPLRVLRSACGGSPREKAVYLRFFIRELSAALLRLISPTLAAAPQVCVVSRSTRQSCRPTTTSHSFSSPTRPSPATRPREASSRRSSGSSSSNRFRAQSSSVVFSARRANLRMCPSIHFLSSRWKLPPPSSSFPSARGKGNRFWPLAP